MLIEKEEIEDLINQKIESGIKQYGKSFKFLIIEILNLEKMLNPEKPQETTTRLIPLSEWNKYHVYPTRGTLYQFSANKEKNGFNEVIEFGGENGGRILINELKFFEWQKNRKKNNYLEK